MKNIQRDFRVIYFYGEAHFFEVKLLLDGQVAFDEMLKLKNEP